MSNNPQIETVYLVGRWALVAESNRPHGEFGGPAVLGLAGEAETDGDNLGAFASGEDLYQS